MDEGGCLALLLWIILSRQKEMDELTVIAL
jgi:hypothetical protein